MDTTPKRIRIRQAEYQIILNAAQKALPEEACGLIAGLFDEGVYQIEKVYMLENTDHSATHFSMDPQEQFSAVKDMRTLGLRSLGNWHSHPATPSRPSEEDKRLAFDKEAIYMILSLAQEEPILNAFHIEGTQTRKELLEICK